MSKYLVSVDGGKTKTEFCIYSIEEKSFTVFSFGGTNYHLIGIENFELIIEQAFEKIFKTMKITEKDILGIVCGISGCDSHIDRSKLLPSLLKIGISKDKVFLGNNGELIIQSFNKQPIACIMAGTGSGAYGYDGNITARSGGWGSPISDLGSIYWIGTQLLIEFIKYLDGQVSHAKIFDQVKELYNEENLWELKRRLGKSQMSDIIHAGMLVVYVAEDEQDLICKNIIDQSIQNLIGLCESVLSKINTENIDVVDVVLSGRLFTSSYIAELFKKQCQAKIYYKNLKFSELLLTPAEHGVEFAQRLFLSEDGVEGEDKIMSYYH